MSMIARTALLAFALVVSSMPAAHAAVMEVGDLNIIEDAGNPSDGLRFLDMTYGDGLTLAAALAAAQATYANARVATPEENDDLFAAAGITFDDVTLTAKDGYAAGGTVVISSTLLGNYDGGALQAMLGPTEDSLPVTNWWTDPDGNLSSASTRDYNQLQGASFLFPSPVAGIAQSAVEPEGAAFGWLIVSDAAPVSAPSTAALFALGLAGLAVRRRRAVCRQGGDRAGH